MECPLEPLGDRIVMRREKLETTVIIPEQFQQANAPQRGVIVRVGDACEWGLEEGDIVLHGQFAGAWFRADGKLARGMDEGVFYIVAESDLVAKVHDV